jgi:P4 family phage/plasmid primase-like protien
MSNAPIPTPPGGPEGQLHLEERHRAEFHASGINDEMIAAAGIRSVRDAEVAALVGWSPKSFQWGSGWAIPYAYPDEEVTTLFRAKLDYPRAGGDGKPVKYESPKGCPSRAYFPPGFWRALPDAEVILLTEGEKKAISAQQRGFATIGLSGVWAFAKPRVRRETGKATGPRLPLDDLLRVEWRGRKVVIAFDNDIAEKPQVQEAEHELAAILTGRGAEVRVLRLPAGVNGEKVGLDDFLVQHGDAGADKLRDLISVAQMPARKRGPGRLPMPLADKFISEKLVYGDGCTLRSYRDELWEWDGRRYLPLLGSDFNKRVLVWLDIVVDAATPRLAENVVRCIAARAVVNSLFEAPCWIGERGPEPQPDWIAVQNGIIDVREVLAGGPAVVREHSPRWFSPVCLPFIYDPNADCPKWREFLEEMLEGDEDRIDLVREWFGYNLVPDVSQHKFMLMEGEGANGKSVCLRVLEALIGEENTAHVSLEVFGERFQLCATIGKLANIVPEVGELNRPEEGYLKAYVAGDTVQIDRKHLTPIQVKPTARITIATNTRPRWADRSEGIWRRMLLVPWRVTVPEEKQDKHLADYILANELPGVFNWAVRGLAALRQRGRFIEPEICREAIEEYRRETNPARTFLLEEYQVSPGAEVNSLQLYAAYRRWCEERGHHPLSHGHFGKELRRVYPIERFQRTEMGRRAWCVTGIKPATPAAQVVPVEAPF